MALNNLRLAALSRSRTPGKHADEQGLVLRITPAGGMYWQWRLRTPRETIVSYGTFPEVSLAEARERHRQAREQRRSGVHPNAAKRKARLEARQSADTTFEAIAREWFKVRSREWAPKYADKVIARLQADIFPRIGRLPIQDITPLLLLATIRKIEARGVYETAARLVDSCSQVFRYAIITGRAQTNAATGLREALTTPPPKKHRPAVTDPKRLGELLRMIDGYAGSYVVRAALRLTPLLLLRPGELRHGQWSEVDLDAGLWTVPPARMKRTKEGKENGTPHLVPLARQAIEILRELYEMTDKTSGGFMFPAEGRKARQMSENTVNAALRALGVDTATEQTGHGFRATARTMLAEQLGWEENVIEAQLAHRVKDTLGRAYNRTQYLEQRRQMMQAWADYLDGLKTSPQSDNVLTVHFQKAA